MRPAARNPRTAQETKSNVNKCANQCTNKYGFPESNLLNANKNCQLKENLRDCNSQMKSVD